MKGRSNMNVVPISEEWLELKAIAKVTAQEWAIPVGDIGNNAILIKRIGGHFEAFHKIDDRIASRTLYYTEEVEQIYKTLSGKNL